MGLFDLFKKKETIIKEISAKGDTFMRENRYEEAVQAYSRIVELNPQSCYHWNNKCDALMKMGKNNEAIKAYNQAINLNPQDVYLCCKKGDALLTMKRYNEAIQAYNQANNIHHTGDAYAGIGSALMELDRYKEALEAYEKAGWANERSDDRFDCEKDHRGCYGSVSSFHSLMEKKCDDLLKMGKYEETIKVAYDGLSVPGENYNQYVEYVYQSLKRMGKHEEGEYLVRKYCEASDLRNEYRYGDARALMYMCIGYLMEYKLNIQK